MVISILSVMVALTGLIQGSTNRSVRVDLLFGPWIPALSTKQLCNKICLYWNRL